MSQYLLNIIQPDGPAPDAEFMAPIMAALEKMNADARQAGVFVFTDGLAPASASTVVRVADGELTLTDGPFVEGKEHVGGFWILDLPDLDAALEWARRGAEATGLPIELRPFASA